MAVREPVYTKAALAKNAAKIAPAVSKEIMEAATKDMKAQAYDMASTHIETIKADAKAEYSEKMSKAKADIVNAIKEVQRASEHPESFTKLLMYINWRFDQ